MMFYRGFDLRPSKQERLAGQGPTDAGRRSALEEGAFPVPSVNPHTSTKSSSQKTKKYSFNIPTLDIKQIILEPLVILRTS